MAFGLLLASCTFSRDKREDSSLREREHATVRAEQAQTETRTEGPETITTTIEEYEDGAPQEASPQGAAGRLHVQMVEAPQQGSGNEQASAQHPPQASTGRIVRRTVTVDQRGPVTDVKRESASETGSEDIGLDMTKHTEEKSSTSYWPPWWLLAGGVLGVAGAGWAAYRFTPWGRALAALL